MRSGRVLGAVVLAATGAVLLVAGDAVQTAGRAPLAGLLLNQNAESTPRTVTLPAVPDLPERAPVLEVQPPGEGDLRDLAERHAGGRVVPGLREGMSAGDLVGFDAGDGWFYALETAFGPLRAEGSARPEDWSWSFEARGAAAVLAEGPSDCGEEPPPVDGAVSFYADLGLDLVPAGPGETPEGWSTVDFQWVVDGLPVIEGGGGAIVDCDGKVLAAAGRFPVVRLLGDYPLAPAEEVVRRARSGPGYLPGSSVCEAPCRLTVDEPPLGLALVTDGGTGGHDHLLDGDEGPVRAFLVPALRLVAQGAAGPSSPRPMVVALSSSVLVDDPAQAAAARRADEAAGGQGGGCDGGERFLLCVSSDEITAGTPIVVTVYADVHQPGGLGCRPQVTVDPGDDSGVRSLFPRAGSLLTGRLTVVWDEPGRHVVRARRSSECASPPVGGGAEPEYDDLLERTVSVRG